MQFHYIEVGLHIYNVSNYLTLVFLIGFGLHRLIHPQLPNKYVGEHTTGMGLYHRAVALFPSDAHDSVWEISTASGNVHMDNVFEVTYIWSWNGEEAVRENLNELVLKYGFQKHYIKTWIELQDTLNITLGAWLEMCNGE